LADTVKYFFITILSYRVAGSNEITTRYLSAHSMFPKIISFVTPPYITR
jgi:hypothetical protein